jgi:hypothetical protein
MNILLAYLHFQGKPSSGLKTLPPPKLIIQIDPTNWATVVSTLALRAGLGRWWRPASKELFIIILKAPSTPGWWRGLGSRTTTFRHVHSSSIEVSFAPGRWRGFRS